MIDRVYLWPVSIYSITMVKATVVRLSVVYMGTFTPLTDAIEASFQEVHIKTNLWSATIQRTQNNNKI